METMNGKAMAANAGEVKMEDVEMAEKNAMTIEIEDAMTDEEWLAAKEEEWREHIGEHIAEMMMRVFSSANGEPRDSAVKSEAGSTVVAKKNDDLGICKGEEWVLVRCEGTSVEIQKEPGKYLLMSDLDFVDVFEDGFDPRILKGYALTEVDYEAVCKKMEQDLLHLAKGTAMECDACGALVYEEDMAPRRHICQSCGYFEFVKGDLYDPESPYYFTYELRDFSSFDVDDVTIENNSTLCEHSIVLRNEEMKIYVYKGEEVVYTYEIDLDTYAAIADRAWDGVMEIVKETNKWRNQAVKPAAV